MRSGYKLGWGYEMKFIEHRGPFRFLIPQYDEIVLFTMSFTCVVLLINGLLSYNQNIEFTSSEEYGPRIIIAGIIFLAGLVLSLYHAFVDRPKTTLEKSFMLLFAVLVNAFSGFMASGYDLANASGWIIVFPILNMINSVFLLFMWRAGVLNESSISDQNAPRGQVMLAAAMVLILYYVCHGIYELIWIQTLSICLVYSINFVRLIESMVFRPLPARDTAQ